MVKLAQNHYGKSRVKIARVFRNHTHNSIQEWVMDVSLSGDFERCFTEGDNSMILATDTMKNIAYWLAAQSKAMTTEEFALEYGEYVLEHNPQVSSAAITLEEKLWQPAIEDGPGSTTTFQLKSNELATARVELERLLKPRVGSGIQDLTILKTANSAFTGFMRGPHTTLPEATDRLLGTRATVSWIYAHDQVDYAATKDRVRKCLLETFSRHASESVQHTLYAMGKAVLDTEIAIQQISLSMPNLHYIPADLSRFGVDNTNFVFVPTQEPFGLIEATLIR